MCQKENGKIIGIDIIYLFMAKGLPTLSDAACHSFSLLKLDFIFQISGSTCKNKAFLLFAVASELQTSQRGKSPG